MRLLVLLVALPMLALSTSTAQNPPSNEEDNVLSIRVFIASAPKATSKVDLSYAIKIPEKERRIAIARCGEILTKDKANAEARSLLYELQEGEGPQAAVAIFHNIDEVWQKEGRRISEVLRANLISFSTAGSRGMSVNVYESHEERARFLIAKLIMAERPKAGLRKRAEGERARGEVTPEEVTRGISYPVKPSLLPLLRRRTRSIYPAEGLKIVLTMRAKEGNGWGEVTPEEVIETYTE